MAADRRDIEKELIDICFFMRGSIDLDQVYQLTIGQKTQISRRLSENQKLSKQVQQLIY